MAACRAPRPLPRPLTIPTVMKVVTLADARYLLFPYDGLCRYLGSEGQRRRTTIRRWGGSLL